LQSNEFDPGRLIHSRRKLYGVGIEQTIIDFPDDVLVCLTSHTRFDRVQVWLMPDWIVVADHWVRHPACIKSEIDKWRMQIMKFVKKAEVLKKDRVNGEPPVDKTFSKKYEAIWEYLTCSKMDDGSTRLTTSFTVFADDSGLKCFVNDKDNERSTCVTADTMADLLATVELALQSDTTAWRACEARQPKRKRGKGA